MSKENSNSRVGILKKLGYIFDGRDKKKLVFLTGAIVVGSFLELLAVMVFMPFIDVLQNRETIQTKWYLKKMYDLLGLHRAEDFMVILAICIIMVYLVKNVYLIVEKDYIFRFSYNTQMKLSTRLLAAYMKEPYTFHLNHNIAVLQRSLYEDTSRFMQVHHQ